MKTLEIRRHSLRKAGGGSQLSQQGVDYARKLGASMGPFTQVVTTVVPRARETAIAMGFAVDHELVTYIPEQAIFDEMQRSRWWRASQPFPALAALMEEKGATWRFGHSLAALWRDLLTPLPDGASALMIGHSGELEISLIACFPKADFANWGPPFGECEGARLTFEGEPEHFTTVEFLRGEKR